MSVRIVLTQVVAGREPVRTEHTFDQKVVPFGRSPDNALTLHDPDKQVSSFHGQFEVRDTGCYVTDLGSLNGTLLNGAQLEPKTPLQVNVGDAVVVGAFRLDLLAVSGRGGKSGNATAEQTIVHLDPKRLAASFGDVLEARYAELCGGSHDERQVAIRGELRTLIANLDPAQARTVLAALAEGRRGSRPGQASAPEDGTSDASPAHASEELLQAGYRVLADVAKHFLGTDKRIRSAAELATFGRLVRQSLEISFEWLSKGLESRREFESEFGAEVTMVMGLEQNPLKGGKSARAIGEYLLDWSAAAAPGAAAVGAAAGYLDGAFRDLYLHQLGLLAGAQRAVDAVLDRTGPERVRERVRARGKSFLGIGGVKEWEEFQALHAELAGSRTRLFDDLIRPSIRDAVRETFDQQLKARPEAGETDGGKPST